MVTQGFWSCFIDAGAVLIVGRVLKAWTQDAPRIYLSYGLGFRYVLSPGLLLGYWATPYDFISSLPLSRWQGTFSLGYAY